METRGYQLSFPTVATLPPHALDARAVLDRERAAAVRDEAIERAEQHAAPEWKIYALATVKRVAEQFAEFSTDKVIEAMQDAPITTHELRALGPVMLSAARAGYISPTPQFVTSDSVSRHRSPKRVWRSRIYGGSQ